MIEYMQQCWYQFLGFLPQLGVGVVILVVFFFLGTFLQKGFRHAADRVSTSKAKIFRLIGSTIRIAAWLTGAISALGVMGVNIPTLVASLGLTGFALGFALRDVLSNILSGALILIYQPFQCGDDIKVAGCEGTVSEINLRYTVLKSEGKTHLIPNATLYTNTVDILEKLSE